jgi:hypothetical protein
VPARAREQQQALERLLLWVQQQVLRGQALRERALRERALAVQEPQN